jgi:hypothetical protein
MYWVRSIDEERLAGVEANNSVLESRTAARREPSESEPTATPCVVRLVSKVVGDDPSEDLMAQWIVLLPNARRWRSSVNDFSYGLS